MTSMRKAQALIGSAVAVLAVAMLALGVGAEPKGDDANDRVYPPNSTPFGMTYGEWSGAFVQWAFSIPAQVTPFLDPDGAQCGTLQSGPVWFLAGTVGGSDAATRKCSIPAGRAIFIPIINYINDYPCPDPNQPGRDDPAFQPAPGQSIEAFLAAGAAAVIQDVDLDSLEAELDGRPVRNLSAFRSRSPLIGFTGATNLRAVDPCITGSPQLGVVDGYALMLKPLSVGTHTFHVKGNGGGGPVEVIYQLTIGGQ